MQEQLFVNQITGKVSGTLKHLSEGQLVDQFGEGNFIALKFNVPENATSVKVGLEPSQGTGLVEIIDDPDKNGAFKITNNKTQKFKIVTTDGTNEVVKYYDLSQLVLKQA